MRINIAHLYPELLNLYSDRGNIICLQKRCEWRGIEVAVQEYQLNDELNLDDTDILFFGGGSDREQKIVAERLQDFKSEIAEYIENDGVMLAVCGGFELIGWNYQGAYEADPEWTLLDTITVDGDYRLIGNIVIESEIAGTIVGFENHAGRTFIGSHAPLGRVVHGFGNNSEDKIEGIIYKNLIGTYMHGPLLPKNPKLADLIILKALRRKYGDDITLAELDDTAEIRAHKYVVNRFAAK